MINKSVYRLSFFVFSFLFLNLQVHAAVINVPADQLTIQSGIDVAKDGDTVLVADGTYRGIGNVNIDFMGKQIIVKSENGPKKTIIDCQSRVNTRGFIFHSQETNEVVLEGFTVKNGNHVDRGGIYCSNSAPTIKNCYILSNKGGIYSVDSNPKIIDSNISNNHTGAGVAFISHPESDFEDGKIKRPRLINCIVSENDGSGIVGFDGASVEIIDCVISNNTNRGIVSDYFSRVYVRYCQILHNTGGGVKGTESSSLNIFNSIIKYNTADNGGGIFCSPTSKLNVIGCVIAENIATENGGGIDVYSSFGWVKVAYCTIVRNTASESGGGVYAQIQNSSFSLSNSILWENKAKANHPEFFVSGSSIRIESCDIRDGLKWIEIDPENRF